MVYPLSVGKVILYSLSFVPLIICCVRETVALPHAFNVAPIMDFTLADGVIPIKKIEATSRWCLLQPRAGVLGNLAQSRFVLSLFWLIELTLGAIASSQQPAISELLSSARTHQDALGYLNCDQRDSTNLVLAGVTHKGNWLYLCL